MTETAPLLEVRDLRVSFPNGRERVAAVRGVSFQVAAGEAVGMVGESGSGKSLAALSLLRLTPPGATVTGDIRVAGESLSAMDERGLRRVRGGRIGLVFQEPMTALDPSFTVGDQVAETVRAHHAVSRREAWQRACDLLARVALPDPARRARDYPHQLSGGQRQRVMIAIALAGGPALLVADEPTTALDVTLQGQVLDLLAKLRAELGLAILLISHDFGVVAGLCQRVLVLYAGRLVESGTVADVLARPAHPYTRALVRAVPRLGSPAPRGRMPGIPGTVPDPAALPSGCAFRPRCDSAFERCTREDPALLAVRGEAGHSAACFLLGEPA